LQPRSEWTSKREKADVLLLLLSCRVLVATSRPASCGSCTARSHATAAQHSAAQTPTLCVTSRCVAVRPALCWA
jgi:hypothetical protein